MYLENASGATADRPELLRLLKDARKGDILLVESIDRPVEDWQKLKAAIDSKGLKIEHDQIIRVGTSVSEAWAWLAEARRLARRLTT